MSSVKWQKDKVTVTTTAGKKFSCKKLIITVPVAVLQANPGDEGYIQINPMPDETRWAINALGNTGVIKIILQFSEPFWKNAPAEGNKNEEPELGFLFGDTTVPTWWTQLPEDNAMITGWLAGPQALAFKDADEETILNEALASLAKLFSKDIHELQQQLVAHHIINWTSDPFTRGAYAYEKVESKNAKRILNTPLESTVYFAGEGFYEGPERGTVEAALLSAREVAKKTLPFGRA